MSDEPNELFEDPRARFMRSEHDMSRAKEPYRNTGNFGPPRDMGSFLAQVGGITAAVTTPYGRFEVPRLIGRGILGGVAGAFAGESLAGSGNDAMRGQRHMDTDGSEERIGQGQGGPQNSQGPRYSRPPRVYGD